ncbi:MAG: sulfatase-like hydrolase/transferase, partial [Planctomycetota bacterium]|nr:sulfatase-like hydrolase/transferase [Planctomycetota bacterium]
MRFATLFIQAIVFFGWIMLPQPTTEAEERPNILWIYLEDVSGWFSCYGDEVIKTPHIDSLAKRGIRFDRFYTSAGVCSAMRSGTILGMMQTSVGAHNH